MMNKPTDWIPADRHKRSENAAVVYRLPDEVVAVIDVFIRISLQVYFSDCSLVLFPLADVFVDTNSSENSA
jgi:hypothetical protein